MVASLRPLNHEPPIPVNQLVERLLLCSPFKECSVAIQRDDPYTALDFHVTLTGILDDGSSIRAAFAEVHGLDVEIVPIEYRTGVEDITVRKLPGLKKFSNITLKRGIIGDLTLWTWLK